jgi:outer membrane autotransporter protein
LAGAVDVGYSALDTSRLINFPTAGLTASSNSSVWHLDGRLRASYLIEQGAFYLKPFVDTDLLYVNMPSFGESGAGPLDLQVESMSNTRFAVTPTFEFGATFPAGDSANVLRPFVSLGATWYSDDTWSVSSSLEGAPAGTDPFVTTTTTPRTIGNLSAGLDIFSAKKTGGLDVRLQYDGQFADHYQNQTGAVKFAVRF